MDSQLQEQLFKLYHNEQHIEGLLAEVKGKQKELDRLVSESNTRPHKPYVGWSVVCITLAPLIMEFLATCGTIYSEVSQIILFCWFE